MAAIRHVLQLYSQLYSTAVSAYMHALGLCNCVRILHRLLLPQFYVTVASDLTRPAGAARKVRFRVFIYRSSRNWFFSHVFVREIRALLLPSSRPSPPQDCADRGLG
eukprot:SAG25_NODE_157_length_13480_cov_7.481653_5_plen_107_part_00